MNTILSLHNVDILKIYMKEFGANNIIFYAMIVHTWADQLLPHLLMEQFDTLPSQCRHFEHMHEGVWFRKINKQNDSFENLDNFLMAFI